ncbi:hypothetical protein V3481_012808 [Fusarium oxysporum f. sp. vasinfectum]
MAIYPSPLRCYREQPGLPTDASTTQEQTAASEAETSKKKRFGMFRKNRAGPKLGTASSDSLAKNGKKTISMAKLNNSISSCKQ